MFDINKENRIVLNTEELIYNADTKIAQNTMPFTGTYFKP